MIEARQIGPFMALRVFVPGTTKHMTLVSLWGRFWVQPPRWALRWWPEASDATHKI